ncbi:MAG TPA: esterase-like activity of phytase family protein, partial [Candidatus Binatia bacterium]|nr:esterase-like activity of phytase family protein [Candidatus Binatia bacterium]
MAAHYPLVQLTAIDLDPDNPQRKEFGRLTLLSAYELRSKDRRFGGLSGLAIGTDKRLYAVSDAGYWLSAQMILDPEGKLVDLTEWIIEPILSITGAPVRKPLHDAEALTRDSDGSFIIAFENVHRVWRYSPPPLTFHSLPISLPIPAEVSKAPRNGGIEGLAILRDGRLLALTEEFRNSDGSYKGWLIDGERFFEVSYLPPEGFRVTDCAALSNGDVIVL